MARRSHKDWDKTDHGHGHQTHSDGHGSRHHNDEDEAWRGNKRSRNFAQLEDEEFEPVSPHGRRFDEEEQYEPSARHNRPGNQT